MKKASRLKSTAKDFYLELKDYLLFLKRTSFFWALVLIVIIAIVGTVKSSFFYASGQLEKVGELGALSFEPTEVKLESDMPVKTALWLVPPRLAKILSFKIKSEGVKAEFTKNPEVASYISEDQTRIVVDLVNLPRENPKVLIGWLVLSPAEAATGRVTIPAESLFLDDNQAAHNINLDAASVYVEKASSLSEEPQSKSLSPCCGEKINLRIPQGLLFFLASADTGVSTPYKIQLDPWLVLALAFFFLMLLIYLSIKIERRLFSRTVAGTPLLQRTPSLRRSVGYQVSSRFIHLEIIEKEKEGDSWKFAILLKNNLPIALPEPYLRIPLPSGWWLDEEAVSVDGACFQNYKDGSIYYLALGTLYPEERHKISFKLIPARI